jgi:hypothetical protein
MHHTYFQYLYNNTNSVSDPPNLPLLLPTTNNIPTDPKRLQSSRQIQPLNPLLLAFSQLYPVLKEGDQ